MANIQYQPSLDLTEFPLEKIHDPRDSKITRTQLLARHATMNFLLSSLYWKLYKRTLRLEHSLGDGFYFVDMKSKEVPDERIKELEVKLHEILQNSDPIILDTEPRASVIQKFQKEGFKDKIGVLKAWQDANIPVVKCGEFFDYVIEPMSTDKSVLDTFEIRQYDHGILLRLPTLLNPVSIEEWKDPGVLHKMFSEYDEWAKLLNVENVAKLNQAIFSGEIKDIILVAEGLHERKFAMIAEQLVNNFENKRVVTIAGPSSSNKTTFAKRLDIQLRVCGYASIIIEMDDYFQDGDKIPFGPDGLQDLEHISAMNVKLLGERVHKLLAGESIPVRKYNFKRSRGEDDPKKRIVLEPGNFLVLEGIHGLNPELLKHIGTTSVTPIYVSALTPLNIDSNHRYPTSDLRLIRRIIRDNQFRGCTARKTLRRWTSVRVGEERNIFPYQANAELFFNSSLVYELPVLSVYARVLLCEATIPAEDEDPTSEESKDITAEARRLLGLIDLCYPLASESVPLNSCIREFIGGSELSY
jgi:uridine kinase